MSTIKFTSQPANRSESSLVESLGDEATTAFQTQMDAPHAVTRSTPPSHGAHAHAPVHAHARVPFLFGRSVGQGRMETRAAEVVMVLEQDASEEERGCFIQEATVLSKLSHPNIVPICNLAHDEGGRLYYTLKVTTGRTLQHIIDGLRHEQPEVLREFTLGRLLTIFRKVCDASTFAHSQDIVHRNLSLENVLVDESGEVLLTGWGCAKSLEDAYEEDHKRCQTRGLTLPRKVTLREASARRRDEKARTASLADSASHHVRSTDVGGTVELDVHTDIAALGGMLCSILTLHTPVEGGTLEEVLAVRPLPHISTGRVPSALAAVVMKALTSDEAERYQTVAAVHADVEAYLHGYATSAEQAGILKRIVLLLKRNKDTFASAAFAGLLLVALAAWLAVSQGSWK